MAKGSAFLLKIAEGTDDRPIRRTMAGLRTTDLTIEPASVKIAASGIFLSNEAESLIRARALSGEVEAYQLSFEDGSKINGRFLIQSLDYRGDFNGERNYSIRMESAAAPEFLP